MRVEDKESGWRGKVFSFVITGLVVNVKEWLCRRFFAVSQFLCCAAGHLLGERSVTSR